MKIFLEIMDMDVISERFKNHLYWKRGCISVHCVCNVHVYKGTFNYER